MDPSPGPGPPAHMQQISSLVFSWVPQTAGAEAVPEPVVYPPACGSVPLSGQPCLASVGEDVPNLAEMMCQGWGIQGSGHTLTGERKRGGEGTL